MDNKETETSSFLVRIGRIDNGEIRMGKVEDIVMETVTTRASMDVVGEVITIIIENNKIITEAEAMG